MKYLKTYEQHWVGPPPEWDRESDYSDDEVKAAEILDSMQDTTLSATDIEPAFDYCDSLNTLFTLSKNYLETEDFKLVPIDTTKSIAEDIKQLFAFREMVENSSIMKYDDESSKQTEFNLVEWNGIKMVDYSTHTDKMLGDEQYFIDGITISVDDYNKLTKIPEAIFKMEDVVVSYLNNEITDSELEELKEIV